MIKIVITDLFLAILGGFLYRMGGSGNYPRYFRELGQGICVVLVMLLIGLNHWSLILCFGFAWVESTYFKRKNTDAMQWNWLLVGLVFGLIPLPYCIATNSHWTGFFIRIFFCSSFTVFWQEWLSEIVSGWFYKTWHKDVTDEFGRGFINIITLPLLLIGV